MATALPIPTVGAILTSDISRGSCNLHTSIKSTCVTASFSASAFSEIQRFLTLTRLGVPCIPRKVLRIYAKKWWQKREDSKLSKDSPLPLSMAYPTPQPLSKRALDKLKSCDSEKEDCKTVIYQWTGKCKSCQGTGLVNYRRKKGRDVITKCISCIGLGFVQKITQRDDIKVMDEAEPE